MIKGVDISNYQRNLNVRSLTAHGISFAIAKISEGQTYVDPCFDTFYGEAYSINLPFGAYVYSHATTVDAARAEASKAIYLLGGRKLRLGIFIDVEEGKQLNCPNLTDIVNAFCDTVRASGYLAGAYGSAGRLWAKVSPSSFNGLVWAASWGLQPRFSCDIWQYTDRAKIDGYSGAVDGDYAMSNRFAKLLEGQEIPVEPPAEAECEVTAKMPILRVGDKGYHVKLLQTALIGKGYNCGWMGADGEFGEQTKIGLYEFQKKNGLETDNICGQATWEKLLEV